MKLADVKSNPYFDFNKENNTKNLKFDVADQVRISKYKNFSAKGYTSNWSEEIFVIKNVKILYHGHMLLVILMLKKLLKRFTRKNWKKQITKSLGLKK